LENCFRNERKEEIEEIGDEIKVVFLCWRVGWKQDKM